MSAVNELLDRAKAAALLPSDYAITKRLAVPGPLVYAWRSGRRLPTQEQVLQLAGLANDPPAYWLAIIEAERCGSDNLSQVWKGIADEKSAAIQ